jgi:hypothetical protein
MLAGKLSQRKLDAKLKKKNKATGKVSLEK